MYSDKNVLDTVRKTEAMLGYVKSAAFKEGLLDITTAESGKKKTDDSFLISAAQKYLNDTAMNIDRFNQLTRSQVTEWCKNSDEHFDHVFVNMLVEYCSTVAYAVTHTAMGLTNTEMTTLYTTNDMGQRERTHNDFICGVYNNSLKLDPQRGSTFFEYNIMLTHIEKLSALVRYQQNSYELTRAGSAANAVVDIMKHHVNDNHFDLIGTDVEVIRVASDSGYNMPLVISSNANGCGTSCLAIRPDVKPLLNKLLAKQLAKTLLVLPEGVVYDVTENTRTNIDQLASAYMVPPKKGKTRPA
jgi:hypothetical protein